MTVVGTRPEIIRLSRVMAALDASEAIEHVIVHTGQNYDYELNQIFFDDLKIYDAALTAEQVAGIYNSGSILPLNAAVVASAERKAIKSSEIYSSDGFKVLSADKNEIDITTLPEGTYLLKISNVLQQDAASKKTTSN